MELGIPYSLVGPDGVRIVVGNSDAAKADPDWVGYLDPDGGIAGLDGAETIERAQPMVEGSGAIHFDFLHGRRTVTVAGVLDPNVDIGTIIAREERLKRATNAMRADAVLTWTNTGLPRRRLLLRRQGPPRITGRRPKSFLLAMVSADYRILADVESSTAATARGVAAPAPNTGTEFAPIRFELTGEWTPTAASPIRVYRAGAEATDVVRMKPGFALAAGDTLVIDQRPPWPLVTRNGVDVYDQVDFLNTRWWQLRAGSPDVVANASAGLGTWRAFWRDAWV